MWVIAGLWHNLVLPAFDEHQEAHHQGIFLMLIAYLVLSSLMVHIYSLSKKTNRIAAGLKTGVVVGVLWVLPHGLAMAGIHETSVLYEIRNAIWHVFEQGLGGVLIALLKPDEELF